MGLGMGTQVNFGSAMLAPTAVTSATCSGSSCEALTVTVPAADVASAGAITLTVANAAQVSNSVSFTVTPPVGSVTGAPQLLAYAPLIAPAGLAVPLFLTVSGENVAQSAMVNFGAIALTPTVTTTVSAAGGPTLTTLQVQVPASALATTAEVAVTITNPGASGGTSNAGNLFIVSKSSFPIEESVSDGSPAVPGDGASTHSSLAMDGLAVAFDSTATNLITGATSGLSQVYVRQNCFNVTPNCSAPLSLVSVAPDGSPGAGGVKGSDMPVISSDGRFIVFESDDTNLVPGVTQGVEQIYLRDTCQALPNTTVLPPANCAPNTILVSASPTGVPGNAASANPVIGGFGLLVAFQSMATNLVSQPVPAGVQQIYLRGGCGGLASPVAGCQANPVLQSVDASGNPGNKDSTNPAMDRDGLVVAFQSLADNIVANTLGNSFQQVYLRATCVALTVSLPVFPCKSSAQAASVDANGQLGTGDSVTPAVGTAGSITVFATRAPNLLPVNTSNQQILAASICFGAAPIPCVHASAAIVSIDGNGLPGQGDSFNPVSGGFGRVAFTSQASLLTGVTGQQVYAKNVCTFSGGLGCGFGLVLVSADSSGRPIGGDHAATDITERFAMFSSAGSSAASRPTQVFLAAPFF
jgi:hypothetical protein